MEIYEYSKYITNKECLKETINKYGVAIIPNVINDSEQRIIILVFSFVNYGK